MAGRQPFFLMETLNLRNRFDDPSAGRVSTYFSRLYILATGDMFQYCLTDTETNAISGLYDYRLKPGPDQANTIAAALPGMLNAQEILRKNYPSVVIGIGSDYHTLVPAALFDRQRIKDVLRLNFRLPGETEVLSDYIPDLDAYNVWAASKELFGIFRENFRTAGFFHASTSLLQVFGYHLRTQGLKDMFFVHFRGQEADMACYRGGRLLFFNSFPCQSKEDLLYFTLYTLEQLQLRPEETRVLTLGSAEGEADLTRLLKDYLGEIRPAGRISPAGLSPAFSSLPEGTYQQLIGLSLCGS